MDKGIYGKTEAVKRGQQKSSRDATRRSIANQDAMSRCDVTNQDGTSRLTNGKAEKSEYALCFSQKET